MKPKSDNKFTPNLLKVSSRWLILPVIAFMLWGIKINRKTLFDFGWWWFILCVIIGFAVGVVRLVRDKEIVWNWKECLGGLYYTLVHSAIGVMFGVFLIFVIEIMNYYIPTDNPYYDEPATVLGKKHIRSRSGSSYKVEFSFENEKFGKQSLSLGYDFYNQTEKGDYYIFTFRNGFFNIPLIINLK